MNKSIEQLENDYWGDLTEYPSGLVKNCYEYRKIPISMLSIEQIRTLISQDIGIEQIIGLTIEKLENDVLAEGDFYPGDLLVATSKIKDKFWKMNPSKLKKIEEIVNLNTESIKDEIGEKKFNRIIERIEQIASA